MTADNTRLHMTVLATPDMANFSGKVHGGQLLKLLDQVAYACASRYAGAYVVTLSVDRVLFRSPIQVGELINFSASVNYTGRTSMEIGVRVDTENIRTGATTHTNSSYLTLVAVDDAGRSVAIAPLTPRDKVGRRRFADGHRRREAQRATFASPHNVDRVRP